MDLGSLCCGDGSSSQVAAPEGHAWYKCWGPHKFMIFFVGVWGFFGGWVGFALVVDVGFFGFFSFFFLMCNLWLDEVSADCLLQTGGSINKC